MICVPANSPKGRELIAKGLIDLTDKRPVNLVSLLIEEKAKEKNMTVEKYIEYCKESTKGMEPVISIY